MQFETDVPEAFLGVLSEFRRNLLGSSFSDVDRQSQDYREMSGNLSDCIGEVGRKEKGASNLDFEGLPDFKNTLENHEIIRLTLEPRVMKHIPGMLRRMRFA